MFWGFTKLFYKKNLLVPAPSLISTNFLNRNRSINFWKNHTAKLGVFGYSAYAPTKFALRGFAEALHSELAAKPHLNVQVAFPPDTDTPGFAEEEKIKPKETKLIGEQAGLSQPQGIANAMVEAAVQDNPSFCVYFNFEGWMLTALTAGMSPVSTLGDALAQVALGGLFRFVSLFYLNDWWRMIRSEAQKRAVEDEDKKKPQEPPGASPFSAKKD
jgi:3-dehydrosphinganine reductase